MEVMRLRSRDSLGNEQIQHDEIRGVGKAFVDLPAVAGAPPYLPTRLDFVLPGTTTFGTGVLVRESTRHFAHLRTIWLLNRETTARDFEFFDGNPGGAPGTFMKLFTLNVLATSSLRLGSDVLEGYMLTFDLFVRPSGTRVNGLEVAVSALIINREVIE